MGFVGLGSERKFYGRVVMQGYYGVRVKGGSMSKLFLKTSKDPLSGFPCNTRSSISKHSTKNFAKSNPSLRRTFSGERHEQKELKDQAVANTSFRYQLKFVFPSENSVQIASIFASSSTNFHTTPSILMPMQSSCPLKFVWQISS